MQPSRPGHHVQPTGGPLVQAHAGQRAALHRLADRAVQHRVPLVADALAPERGAAHHHQGGEGAPQRQTQVRLGRCLTAAQPDEHRARRRHLTHLATFQPAQGQRHGGLLVAG